MARGELVGVSALVYQNGAERYFGAFGEADREANRAMARDTIVQIWSMTKPVTGVALMQLWEEGRFDLDDPITDYIPEFADARVFEGMSGEGTPILAPPRRIPTVRDMTRHTAGLTGAGGGVAYVDRVYASEDPLNVDNPLEEAVRRLARVPLLYHPGERWFYSDSVSVQALMVQRLSGEPFARYLQRRIFEPLGMVDTSFFLPPEKHARLAATYDRADNGAFVRRTGARGYNLQRHALTPGGWGLVSTLDDYMRFARMLVNEGKLEKARILKRQTVRLMRTDQLPEEIGDKSWLPGKGRVGFGTNFAVRIAPPASEEENFGIVGEFFWDGAASTLFWCDPANDLAAVLFVQVMPFDRMHLHRTFRRAVYEAMGQYTFDPEANLTGFAPNRLSAIVSANRRG